MKGLNGMSDKSRVLIHIPASGNYIEILGYKIHGFKSFEAFCEHLKKYAELEEANARQKDEIESLTVVNETLQKYVAKLNKELARADVRVVCIGRSNGKSEMQRRFMQSAINEIKSEAIKEFAERLKEESFTICHHKMVLLSDIDNLVKEMAGDTNDR